MDQHARRHLQTERVILFSDAVMAIAITLLVIEIKVPELHEATSMAAWRALGGLVPKLIGFVVGFLVISVYWVSHHRLFGYVVDFNQKLLWANLFFLFSITIMPFTTAFYSEYFSLDFPFFLYCLNVIGTGMLLNRLWTIVSDPRQRLSAGLENRRLVKYFKLRSRLVSFVFLLGALTSAVGMVGGWRNVWVALTVRSLPMFLPFLSWLVARKHRDLATE